MAHANGQPTLNIHLMNDNFVISMRSGNESSTVRINRECARGLGYRKLTVIRLQAKQYQISIHVCSNCIITTRIKSCLLAMLGLHLVSCWFLVILLNQKTFTFQKSCTIKIKSMSLILPLSRVIQQKQRDA